MSLMHATPVVSKSDGKAKQVEKRFDLLKKENLETNNMTTHIPGKGLESMQIYSKSIPNRTQLNVSISPPSDDSEKEADRIAEEALYDLTSDLNVRERGPISFHTKGQEVTRTTRGSHTIPDDATVETYLTNLDCPGNSIPSVTRRFYENRFGYDFSHVRIHSDKRAAELNASLGANAFTRGRDIYFAVGQYKPHRPAGRFLLAHELAHVLQHKGSNQTISCSLSDNTRKTIVETALSLSNEHYLMGAAGQVPDLGGGLNSRNVTLDKEHHAACVDVNYGKEKGIKTHVCGGRYVRVKELPEGDPAIPEHHKNPSKYKWTRISDGDAVSGEACEGKKHFDCGGFVSYCYHQAYPEVKYPGPASAITTSSYGWISVDKEATKPGDIAYRTGHAGLFIGEGRVISALGKKWGITTDAISKYSQFGSLKCVQEPVTVKTRKRQ